MNITRVFVELVVITKLNPNLVIRTMTFPLFANYLPLSDFSPKLDDNDEEVIDDVSEVSNILESKLSYLHSPFLHLEYVPEWRMIQVKLDLLLSWNFSAL